MWANKIVIYTLLPLYIPLRCVPLVSQQTGSNGFVGLGNVCTCTVQGLV